MMRIRSRYGTIFHMWTPMRSPMDSTIGWKRCRESSARIIAAACSHLSLSNRWCVTLGTSSKHVFEGTEGRLHAGEIGRPCGVRIWHSADAVGLADDVGSRG